MEDHPEASKRSIRHAIISHPRASAETVRRLEVGGILTIGRRDENGLVVKSASVSRFHASIRWLAGRSRPEIIDHGSQNGTRVDGVAIGREPVPLQSGARIEVGSQVLRFRLHEPGSEALLEDAPEVVALYSEVGAELSGRLESTGELLGLLRTLEVEHRTGTLRVQAPGQPTARITFARGRIVAVKHGDALRTRALERVLLTEGDRRYRFGADLEPTDNPMDLWFSDFVRRWQRGYTPRLPHSVQPPLDRRSTG
jgi:pSer/pThr/pTyr-binding forkhead associated (FHA) protein